MTTKAKSSKKELEVLNSFYEKELGSRIKKVVNPIAYDWLIRSLSKITRASYMEGLEDGKEQGKKDAEKKCPYATGIPPYFKKAKEKCIVVIGERDIIRKQTLEEVLKDDFDEERQGLRYVFRKKLEQRIKEMG